MNINNNVPELLSPAGDVEKLKTVYAYGADAAYIGINRFSLRESGIKSDSATLKAINDVKNEYKGKKLYAAVNMFFFDNDIQTLNENIDEIKDLNVDGFIVSDLGAAMCLKRHFPSVPLHLSTQASCTNSESVKVYKDLGFSRIILAREVDIDNIRRIKDAVPDMEIEVFVHGAMCMAVSGRCILSSVTTHRSANRGECAHTCRWKYRVAIEEEKREGEYLPLEEHNGWNTILSSKDLCMIDHLDELIAAGVSSLKIEGRMKSTYYAALITRAYRKMLDKDKDAVLFRDEIEKVSHREWTTGFFYNNERTDFAPPREEYTRLYRFLGTVISEVKKGVWEVDIKYQISSKREIEAIGPDVLSVSLGCVETLNKDFENVEHIDHCMKGYIKTDKQLKSGYILREKIRD